MSKILLFLGKEVNIKMFTFRSQSHTIFDGGEAGGVGYWACKTAKNFPVETTGKERSKKITWN